MSKKGVMISIDEDLHKEAKEKMVNISQVTNIALSEKLKGNITDDPEERQCFKCGVLGSEIKDGGTFIWVCPDEKWFCSRCWKKACNDNILVAVASR